jgi:hypothetical protein
MLETFHIETLKIGDLLKLYYSESDYIELQLVKVAKSRYQNVGAREGFSWIFTAGKQYFIEPGTHRVQHEFLGAFDLGLSQIVPPIGETEFSYFEACFN